ncbi:MAG: hypothetical protein ABI612_17330, partial [Betaproteobacteria bacterium]
MTQPKLRALLAVVIGTLAVSAYAANPPAVISHTPVPVTVTNPVQINSAAPLRTTEAYPRTAVHFSDSVRDVFPSVAGTMKLSEYQVPSDKLLVI